MDDKSKQGRKKCMYVDFLIVLSYTICDQWWCSCERNMLPFHIFVMMMRLMTYLKPTSQCKFINGVLVYFFQCFRESSVVTIAFIKWSNKGFKDLFSCFKCKLIFDSPQPPVATYITYIKYNWTWFYSCILFLRVPRETKSTSSTKVLETLPLTMPKQRYNPVTSMRWQPTSKIWSSSR